MVNKFMAVSRLYGIIFVVAMVIMSTWFTFFSLPPTPLCYSFWFLFRFISCSFWSIQLLIALVRYFYVMHPIYVHNYFPTNNYKEKLFILLFKLSFIFPLMVVAVDLVSHFHLNNTDLFLEVCLQQDEDPQLVSTMQRLLLHGAPYVFFIYPCIGIYLRLMTFTTYHPIRPGLDPKIEKVNLRSI